MNGYLRKDMIFSQLNRAILFVFSLTALAACRVEPAASQETLADQNSKKEPAISSQKTDKDKCYINYPKEQKHLAEAECLTLPISSKTWFQSYPRLSNGFLDLNKIKAPKDVKEYIYAVPTSVPEHAKVLGVIPYNDSFAWLVVAINGESEESEGNSIVEQEYVIYLVNRKDGSIGQDYTGLPPLGSIDLVYESFYDNKKLLRPPFNFKKIDGILSYHVANTLSLKPQGKCVMEFELSKEFVLKTDRVCYEFHQGKKSISSKDKTVWKLNPESMKFEDQEISSEN